MMFLVWLFRDTTSTRRQHTRSSFILITLRVVRCSSHRAQNGLSTVTKKYLYNACHPRPICTADNFAKQKSFVVNNHIPFHIVTHITIANHAIQWLYPILPFYALESRAGKRTFDNVHANAWIDFFDRDGVINIECVAMLMRKEAPRPWEWTGE